MLDEVGNDDPEFPGDKTKLELGIVVVLNADEETIEMVAPVLDMLLDALSSLETRSARCEIVRGIPMSAHTS